jgi:hypothetical protein
MGVAHHLVSAAVLVVLALGFTSCASDSSSPTGPGPSASGPTAAEVRGAVNSFKKATTASIAKAMAASTPNSTASSSPLGPRPMADQFRPLAEQINVSVAGSDPCTQAGTVAYTGTVTGSIDVSGTTRYSAFGSLNLETRTTMFNCSADGRWFSDTASGSPIRMNGTIFFNDTRQSMNLAISGAWAVASPNGGRTNCQWDGALVQWDNLTDVSFSGGWRCDNGVSGRLSD